MSIDTEARGLASSAGAGNSGRRAPHMGFASTRCKLPNALGGSLHYFNSRSRHVARARLVNPQVILPNFYATSSGEAGSGAAATYNASFEYQGVNYPVAVGAVANNSFKLSSPAIGADIPEGAPFYIRVFGNCPGGLFYTGDGANDVNRGECFAYSATSIADLSGGTGTFTTSDAVNIFLPVGIVAMITKPSLLIVGDSISQGLFDVIQDASGDFGVAARVLGPSFGYTNLGVGSETTAGFVANAVNRVLLGAWASHLIMEHGANDLGNSLAQLQSDALALRNLFPSLLAYQCTTTPSTTSTDAGITSTNQTPSANESRRTAWNDIKRYAAEPYQGCIEIADLVETNASGGTLTMRNGGRWKAGYAVHADSSFDGLHPGPTGYSAMLQGAPSLRPMLGG